MRHVRVGEDAARTLFRAERRKRRVRAEHRDPEPDGELHLVLRGRERQQQSQLGIGNKPTNPLDRAGALKQLLRQRLVRGVDE